MRTAFTVGCISLLLSWPAQSAELVRMVRMKIAAGDLLSGAAAVEDHRHAHGADAEYLDAVGWLARGAQLVGKPELARKHLATLRAAIPEEKPELVVPFGAAIEVEGRLLEEERGRAAALRYFHEQLDLAKAPALRSRIWKNINLLSLEGQSAPPLGVTGLLGPRPQALNELRGRPVLLYFFAEWCGDCKAQAASLGRIWKRYAGKGLQLIAVTRLYGGSTKAPLTPAEEMTKLERVWRDTYPALEDVSVVVDTETMIRYGASATPSFAFIGGDGNVAFYTPTRLSEEELAQRIEELLVGRPATSTR